MATINNLFIDQGTTYSVIVQVFGTTGSPYNLSGFQPAGQIRKSYNSNTVSATFNASIADSPNGKIYLSLTAQETANLKHGRYVYDVEVTNGDIVFRASEGIVTVYPQVTR